MQQMAAEATKRLLRIALVGAPNAGKSTLLNRLIYSDISCVSNKVHTTRRNVLGVYTDGDAQLEFLDSPGLVTRQHLLKHRLEDSLLSGPQEASEKCDLIALVVDASNRRECRRLGQPMLNLLHDHQDKESFLVLNKIDLVKDKRVLLDIGQRLTDGHLEGRPTSAWSEPKTSLRKEPHKYVIELSPQAGGQDGPPPRPIGYRNFSGTYSISALNDDGVDELRESLIELAKPIEIWPHGPDYVTNQSTRDIVLSSVRGKLMDHVEREIPYVTRFYFDQCQFDEMGALHVQMSLVVPKKYMVGKILGEHGTVIFKVINESRELIQRTLTCDVKMNIAVNAKRS